MINKTKEIKGAPQLKSISLHNGVVMGVSMTDEILVLAYIYKEKEAGTEDTGVMIGTPAKKQRKTKNGLGSWSSTKIPMKPDDEDGSVVVRELATVEADSDA